MCSILSRYTYSVFSDVKSQTRCSFNFIPQFKADEYVASVTHDKAFLHFQLNTSTLIRSILENIDPATYGTNDSGKGKKLVIEYSSPNIAKSFHVGHLRSTIIGSFLANLYQACGWDVVRVNYLGDWGTQVRVDLLIDRCS